MVCFWGLGGVQPEEFYSTFNKTSSNSSPVKQYFISFFPVQEVQVTERWSTEFGLKKKIEENKGSIIIEF